MRIVLVDDHEVVRLGVRAFLAVSPGLDVVGEAGTGRDALKLVEAAKPNVVLMDLVLPDMDGVVATREILRRQPQTRVAMLSAYEQNHDVTDAMNAGALAYVLKGDPPETLLAALHQITQGRRYFSPGLAARRSAIAAAPPGDALDVLSEREREIFRLAADCRSAQEIARNLCLARKTVDTHLNRIHRKLGIRDRAELVRMAAGLGLVHTLRRPPMAAPRDGVGGAGRLTRV
jgi:DNA-binding NarL/FixJ family response regulator